LSSHLADNDSTIDFEIVKCQSLPELLDEEQFSKWGRGNGNNGAFGNFGNSGGFGGKHNRH
jgi:hypothetical protein